MWMSIQEFNISTILSHIYTHNLRSSNSIHIEFIWNGSEERFVGLALVMCVSLYRGHAIHKEMDFISCTMCSTLLIRGLHFFLSLLICFPLVPPQNVLFGCDDFFLWFLVLYLHLGPFLFSFRVLYRVLYISSYSPIKPDKPYTAPILYISYFYLINSRYTANFAFPTG